MQIQALLAEQEQEEKQGDPTWDFIWRWQNQPYSMEKQGR